MNTAKYVASMIEQWKASGADGIFGKNTEAALVRFQRDHGLAADGICGPLTYAALEAKPETQLYTVHVPMLPLYQAEALVNAFSSFIPFYQDLP